MLFVFVFGFVFFCRSLELDRERKENEMLHSMSSSEDDPFLDMMLKEREPKRKPDGWRTQLTFGSSSGSLDESDFRVDNETTSDAFIFLKQKIGEMLRKVERVQINDFHLFVSTRAKKGHKELHLHVSHLKYFDDSQKQDKTNRNQDVKESETAKMKVLFKAGIAPWLLSVATRFCTFLTIFLVFDVFRRKN